MAYMDNPQPLGKRARRVIPGYMDLASDYLGMAQIVLAFLCLIMAFVAFIIRAYPAAPITAILLAVPVSIDMFVFKICGILYKLIITLHICSC